MIFGVPVGSQTIVVNVDLSDIGDFSLSPQDLIRMGVATPAQVNGTKFKSSTNLNELPQIITINRTLEVEPLWGDESLCTLGITRTDFDLSAEKNINIQPTSIFMGSMISSTDDQPLKRKCKPSLKGGSLCNMVAGPGQIQAIRQTIFTDVNGRPGLEVASLEEGGQVIDDNGTWMFDVPMNLDYVVTNEFGEQVISKDPKKGIPTRGKYRFKVMWNQSTDLGERVKRANFLVPNIKEYGWVSNNGIDPLTGKNVASTASFGNAENPCDYGSTVPTTNNGRAAKASYAFSLDWSDYGEKDSADKVTALGDRMILDAVNCKDRFCEMKYNKVYTVSQLISEYRKGIANNRIIAVKNILDDVCESTNNKFPANDGMYRFDIIFLLFSFLMFLIHPILAMVVLIAHIFFWVLCNIILPVLRFLKVVVCGLKDAICTLKDKSVSKWHPFKFLAGICTKLTDACASLTESVASLEDKCKNSYIPLPNLTFPDCEICACDPPEPVNAGAEEGNALAKFNSEQGSNSAFADLLNTGAFGGPMVPGTQSSNAPKNGYFGFGVADDKTLITGQYIESPKTSVTKGAPTDIGSDSGDFGPDWYYFKTFTTDLPWHERFNLFNTKAKYFNNGASNPGGGVNQIGVRFNTDMNGLALTADGSGNLQGKFHLDNVIAVLVDSTQSGSFKIGNMMTFVDPALTGDINLTGVTPSNDYGTMSITGSTIGTFFDSKTNLTTVQVKYANPNGTTGTINGPAYVITGSSENTYHRYPMDLEYFQVIENTSVDDYFTLANSKTPDLPNSFYTRVLNGGYNIQSTYGTRVTSAGGPAGYDAFKRILAGDAKSGAGGIETIINYYKGGGSLRVIFLVRGVDPNSPKTSISYDLSKLYGKKTFGHVINTIPNMRMNIPIQGKFKCVKHENISLTTSVDSGYSGLPLFYETFMWKPSISNLGVAPGIDESKTPPVPFSPPTLDPEYRPNGWCDWKPFISSVALSYYSCLDESTDASWGLTGWNGHYYSSNGLRIGGLNAYTYKYYAAAGCFSINTIGYFGDKVLRYQPPNNADNGSNTQPAYAKYNGGYFPNESVEGGNLALLEGIGYPGCWWGWTDWIPAGEVPEKNGNMNVNVITDSRYVSFTYALTYGAPSLNFSSLGSNDRQIVMRSDRLPSSSSSETGDGNTSYTLMANNNFSFFIMSDDGTVTSLVGTDFVDGVGGSADTAAANAENGCSDLLNTFTCEGLIPLDCYYYDKPNNRVDYYVKESPIASGGANSGRNEKGCYGNGLTGAGVYGVQPESIMEGGCYRLVTAPFKTLRLDWELLKEWKARMIITFAACRNVFSHYFTNNWINGTLYAFSFVNSRRFTGPTDPVNPNKPYNCFCKTNVFFNTDSNNFYYRSSPYNETKGFVGRKGGKNWFTGKKFGNNENHLMYPTTTMDLGPRDIYTQEIAFSNDYDGYVMNNLNTTTYQDVSDLLNVFILTRLTNKPFIKKMIGGYGVKGYFSRENKKIDGDYAQSISINSELGVEGFDADSYDNCDIYYNGGDVENAIFGIYYSSNTQIRDFVTPKRTIISEEKPITQLDCAFEYFDVKTQVVPFYQWNVKKNFIPDDGGQDTNPTALLGVSPPDSIFGSQFNDWSSVPYSGTTFFSYDYQKLDRLNKQSRYTRTKGGGLKSKYFRGNIYSVDNSGSQNPDGANVQYWDLNDAPDTNLPLFQRVVNTGAPFHFYFGLNKGKSAFDRFTKKWIDSEVTTD